MRASKERDEIYYLVCYAYYKLRTHKNNIDRYSSALIAIDEALTTCINPSDFNKLLLMIRIHERDIYEAIHLVARIKGKN